MVLESNLKLCVTESSFLEKFFSPQKLGKLTQNGPKTGIFQFIGKFGHQFLLNLIYMKFIIFAVFLHKSHIWENFCSYGPKCSQPIRLQDFLINRISRTNQWNSPILCMLIQIYIKADQKIFGWAWPEMGVTSLITGL